MSLMVTTFIIESILTYSKQKMNDYSIPDFENNPEQKELFLQALKAAKIVFKETNIPLNYHECYDGPNNWSYFSPLHFFNTRFIDTNLIEKLKQGQKLLSVGPGDASLEHLISKGFNIPPSQITLADVEFDPKALTQEFETLSLNMLKEWELNKKYDIIIFPESFGVAHMRLGEIRTYRFIDDVEKDTELILNNQEPQRPSLFTSLIENDAPRTVEEYKTIQKAVNSLNPQGEIRIQQGLNDEQEIAYVIHKLKLKHPKTKFKIPAGSCIHLQF